MSFVLQSDLPVWHEPVAFFRPDPMQVGERGVIDDGRDRVIYLPPQLREGGIRLALPTRLAILPTFKEAENLADGNLVGRTRQQVAAFGSAPRLDEPALFQ